MGASFSAKSITHLANGPTKYVWFLFPTKYVSPKVLKLSHWPSKIKNGQIRKMTYRGEKGVGLVRALGNETGAGGGLGLDLGCNMFRPGGFLSPLILSSRFLWVSKASGLSRTKKHRSRLSGQELHFPVTTRIFTGWWFQPI